MASSKVVLLVVLLVITVSRVRSRSLFKRRGVRNYNLLNFTVYISEPSTNGQWPHVHADLNPRVKPSSSIHRAVFLKPVCFDVIVSLCVTDLCLRDVKKN